MAEQFNCYNFKSHMSLDLDVQQCLRSVARMPATTGFLGCAIALSKVGSDDTIDRLTWCRRNATLPRLIRIISLKLNHLELLIV
jgi:hypothetical protein